MAKTGRPWNVGVEGGVAPRAVRADDHIETKLNIPPILSPEGMGRLVGDQLRPRGFKDGEGGTLVRERGGVTTTINPQTGEMTVRAEGDITLPPSPPSRCGCRIQAGLRELQAAQDDLQGKITARLEDALRGIGCEVEGAINRALKEALLQRARELGEIKRVEDNKDGTLTVVVEVA